MKFSQMVYERPDFESIKLQLTALTERLAGAKSYEEAKAAFLEKDTLEKHLETLMTLAHIRHTINTEDEFYDGEMKVLNDAGPVLTEYLQKWNDVLLESAFRPEFEKEYGTLMFVNAEMEKKTFSPEIIPLLQEENELKTNYEKLLASAQIPFEGNVYTISQITPFKNDADDERRLAAWKAEGQWYKDNQKELDDLYDKLVHVRDAMGKKLGYDGYTELGYYRMQRNCYDKQDV